ncbi:hypothetical protein ACROYT_G018755 [Oculina patagonica]
MHVWMIFLLGTAVYGISRISQPGLKAVNFAKAIEGWMLNGSVIHETEVDSESSCRFECVEDERCRSYNFGPAKNKHERFMCQLSDSDRFHGRVNFTEDKDFRYGGIQSPCETDRSLCGQKGICIPNYQDNSARCNCSEGYKGKPCKPKSCAQLLQDGFTSNGVYFINPDGGSPMQVLCDMTTDGGGWTVFQRRLDGSVDFYRGWESYKTGFGDPNGEFWLRNDNLHRLTASGDVTLRVDLEDFDGNTAYAEYTTFKVADEGDKYRLLIGGYNGTAGDSMAIHNDSSFTTKDDDNDGAYHHCAQAHKGAWWYTSCHHSNLNGLYLEGSFSTDADGVVWGNFRGWEYSLKRTEMKVK